VSDRELHCDTCRGVRMFEVPPCVDDHGADCPELVCTGCGDALLIATTTPLPTATDGGTSGTRGHSAKRARPVAA
jgi:hypothetical protein